MFSIVLLVVGALTICLDTTSAASFSNALTNGICLCTNEQNVAALRDPTDSGSVLQTLANGQCFRSNGGVYHDRSSGDTWYQVKDSSSQSAWVDGYYLSITDMGTCTGLLNDQSPNTHIPKGQGAGCTINSQSYSHGQHFMLHGTYCTCDDGAPLCSIRGQNCFEGGIVYAHGSTVDISGKGVCHCSRGTMTCNGGGAVGK